MEQKYLIRYENGAVYSISEAPESGIIYIAGSYIIDTLPNAKIMLNALNINYNDFGELIDI